MSVYVCFADIKFARHVTWIYWMNAEAAAAAEPRWAECVVTKSLYILYCSGCFIPFISFHFIWYFCLNLQSSKIHRCRARSHCTSSPLLQSLLAFIFCSLVRFFFFISCVQCVSLSFSFSARQFLFGVCVFFIIILYYILFYSVSLILWLCRMRADPIPYLLLIYPIE